MVPLPGTTIQENERIQLEGFMAHDIAGLERNVRALHEAISQLHDAKHPEKLVPIIHRPGWTTIAEFELVQNHVEHLHNQVRDLHKAFDALMATAEKIGHK
jgi:HD-GYP domain-containing protein (c-di-GMP phosphodiesterase class II)